MKLSYVLLAIVLALIATTTIADKARLAAKFAQLFNQDTGKFRDEFVNDITGDDDKLDCKFEAGDISAFKGEWTGTDPTDPGHYSYTMSFCQESKEDKCKDKGGALCQYDVDKDNELTAMLASFTAQPLPTLEYIEAENPDSGYQLKFVNGDECPMGFTTRERVVTMKLTCDRSNKEKTFQITEPRSDCEYEVDIASKFACDGATSGGGLSGGAIFLLIVLGVALIYTLFGCIICVAKFGKPIGIEACPHKDFWCSLPKLFVAGIGFTIAKIKGCFGGKTIATSSGEYDQA